MTTEQANASEFDRDAETDASDDAGGADPGGHLWDDPTTKAITSARPLRAWHELTTVLAEEVRTHFTEYGIECMLVDRANVTMLTLDWHRDGFKSWSHPGGDIIVGLNLSRLRDVFKFGRLRQDDPCSLFLLDGDKPQYGVRITRPDQQVSRNTQMFGIPTGSIRAEPTTPDNVYDAYGWKAHLSPKPFYEAVNSLTDMTNHVKLSGRKAALVLSGTGDEIEDRFQFPNSANCQPWEADTEGKIPEKHIDKHADDETIISGDYLLNIAQAIKAAKMDRVTLGFGSEFPVAVSFEHDEWGISGEFMIAPRIQSD